MLMTHDDAAERLAWIRKGNTQCSRGALLERQGVLLQELVSQAARHVPFYRKKFEGSGLDLESVGDVGALEQLPLTTREELQTARREDVLADWALESRLAETRTSGSSGRPLTIRQTVGERIVYAALRNRTLQELGIVFDQTLASVILPESKELRSQARIENGRWLIDCRLPPAQIARELAKIRPMSVAGFPGALCAAVHAAEPAILEQIRPRITIVGGEVCTSAMREILEREFQAPLSSTYACTEAQWMAGECAASGALHVLDDSLVLEVVDEEGVPVAEGEEGDVVITALHTFSQPFIRYKIGDRATQGRAAGSPSPCSCGAPYSTIRQVVGRMNDVLILPTAIRMNAYTLTRAFLSIAPFIARYQIIQEREDWIRCCIVPSSEPKSEQLERLRAHGESILGAGVRFDVEIRSALESEANGKFRIVRSKLQTHFA